jgi:hypothetical protein
MALCNALESQRRPGIRNPPRTTGTQISSRLDENILNHVDVIVEQSGWNRTEVLYALVQRGLFDFYFFADDETVEKIIEVVMTKAPPSQPPVPPYS